VAISGSGREIIRSEDNGITWKLIDHSLTEDFGNISSFGNTFVITGMNGLISISTDNGKSFQERLPTNIVGSTFISRSSNFNRNIFLLIGEGGKIFRSVFDFDLTNYFEFDSVISQKIEITMNKTQEIDNEKEVGTALCFNEIGTVQTNPSEVDFEFNDFGVDRDTGTGGNSHITFGEKYQAEIVFSDAMKTDMALFRKLKNLNVPFFILPGGGIDREQEGFRLRDIFRVNFTNSFEPNVKSNLFDIGTILAMEVKEI